MIFSEGFRQMQASLVHELGKTEWTLLRQTYFCLQVGRSSNTLYFLMHNYFSSIRWKLHLWYCIFGAVLL